jgi:peptidoglycan/LPS O-acetylase OafA/YrhL
MEAGAGFRLGYRRWLDGLRGVAILLVLAFHLNLLSGGFLGVDIFFVLSGFLITSLLGEEWQRNGRISLKQFYLRRALRLLPALLALLLASGATCFWAPSWHDVVARGQEMAVAACYVSNWPFLHKVPMPTLGHTWSLSVEEQFYLLWPLLFSALLGWGVSRRRILGLVVTGVLAAAALRLVLYGSDPPGSPARLANMMRVYMGLDTRADALLVGCLVGLLTTWNLLPRSPRFVAGTGAAALACAAVLAYCVWHKRYEHSHFYQGLFTGVALMVGVILVRLLVAPSRLVAWVLESAPLVGIGRISYGLYLFHWPILRWLQTTRLGSEITPLLGVLVIGLSLAAALLSYYVLERPCLRLKARLAVTHPAGRGTDASHGRTVPAEFEGRARHPAA